MLEIILIALALAMDCFTVSIVSGIIVKRHSIPLMLRMAFLFGLFQALMPFIGWAVSNRFASMVEAYDHWIAFGMLFLIGGKMILESVRGNDGPGIFDPWSLRSQLLLAVATSIDALAVGISFACTGYSTLAMLGTPLLVIGLVSFAMSIAGFVLGVRFGEPVRTRLKPEIAGGIILIAIGIRILIEHLG